MEVHDLTTKMMEKIPKIALNCEGWASKKIFPEPAVFRVHGGLFVRSQLGADGFDLIE